MIGFSRCTVFSGLVFLLLWGCASAEKPAEVRVEDVMLFLEPGLRPEPLLFPEYLFLEGFELDQHGRIPQTALVGAGLKTKMPLKMVLRRYKAVLALKGWRVGTVEEEEEQSFRLMAVKKGETLEIRVVQGTGLTQVFILYWPLL